MPTIIQQPLRLHLTGAPAGTAVGVSQSSTIQARRYEVRCSAPVRLHDGISKALTVDDVLVLPEAPLRARLSSNVTVAAASSSAASVWFLALEEERR